ncbi:hypothetical protein HDU67_007828 [Dinochytrium kinnereticum]|nr:hypothetical protein HDU67_007828 [Dinochytrium kinnereticum]
MLLTVFRLLPRIAEDYPWLAQMINRLRPRGKITVTNVPLNAGQQESPSQPILQDMIQLTADDDLEGNHAEVGTILGGERTTSTEFLRSHAPHRLQRMGVLSGRLSTGSRASFGSEMPSMARSVASLDSWNQHWVPSGTSSPPPFSYAETSGSDDDDDDEDGPGMWEIAHDQGMHLMEEDDDPFSDENMLLPPAVMNLADPPPTRLRLSLSSIHITIPSLRSPSLHSRHHPVGAGVVMVQVQAPSNNPLQSFASLYTSDPPSFEEAVGNDEDGLPLQ